MSADELLTAKQAAWMIGLSPDAFSRLVREGTIPGEKSIYRGRLMFRVKRSDVEALKEHRERQGVRGVISKPAPNIPENVRALCLAITEAVKAGDRLKDIFDRAGIHYSSYKNWCQNGNPSMTAAQAVANAIGYEYVLKPIDKKTER